MAAWQSHLSLGQNLPCRSFFYCGGISRLAGKSCRSLNLARLYNPDKYLVTGSRAGNADSLVGNASPWLQSLIISSASNVGYRLPVKIRIKTLTTVMLTWAAFMGGMRELGFTRAQRELCPGHLSPGQCDSAKQCMPDRC